MCLYDNILHGINAARRAILDTGLPEFSGLKQKMKIAKQHGW